MAISTASGWLYLEQHAMHPVLLTTTVATFILAFWVQQITLHPGWGRRTEEEGERKGGVAAR